MQELQHAQPDPVPSSPDTSTYDLELEASRALHRRGYPPRTMDLSATRKKLDLEEQARRMIEGRCLRYGGLGHLTYEGGPGRRPASQVQATEARIREEALIDEDEAQVQA